VKLGVCSTGRGWMLIVAGVLSATGLAVAASGSGWSVQRAPNNHAALNQLSAVSCPSSSDCVAVGESDSERYPTRVTLAERWDGREWTIQRTPNPVPSPADAARQSVLNGISCISENSCVAVGSFYNGSESATLAERWNGHKWRIQRTPNPKQLKHSELWSVSCASASDCIAVGDSFIGQYDSELLLAERWNGRKWTIQRPPNPGDANSDLSGISCPAERVCTAVGGSEAVGTFAERWNGSVWTVQPLPDRPNLGNILSAVSCPSAHVCVTVGESVRYYYKGEDDHTLIERWNGTKWTIQHSGDVGPLVGLSCTSARACTSVSPWPFAYRWNGRKWTIEHTPNPSGSATLQGVSCPSISKCTAVGDYLTDSSPASEKVLAERWNHG
jgi:hypothetical protein